ncbi:asparagine synthase (glutamine-hydrolyzing) [Pseudomonas sp. CC6-YY-74]|uniref:asparagine synthase (glutamine-hydrolyzing) n=1 Tax=Pseudomonas sp. CC6-YY-74 TaxID=1930532 RepID=UPI0009A1985C|nr:asparagine synthase (glutamine-hydrolyzing) [Pseudomonas sp. CC6-YY-74]
MCGFTGYLGHGHWCESEQAPKTLALMANTIISRGPDDFGIWQDEVAGIGLAHRRLSIVDLTPAGHQPMFSVSERYVIAFNGEIYNHLALRAELERTAARVSWRGHSDTETLLAGFDVWGIQKTLERAIGMFAFAVWDRQTNTLMLARDRLGEKPLYYGWMNGTFLFGSELKALKAHPVWSGEIDRGALSLYMRHNYIPAPYSIYKGISKLRPGCLLTISLKQREPRIVTYWSGAKVAVKGVANIFTGSATQAVDDLETLLKDAVRQQMMADVPLGAFLSGGVDSSTVVALMQAQSSRPVQTFTIGFNEEGYNEAVHAKAVAKHLGTDHTELYVTAEQALAVIPRLPTLYDEPFSDSSQIPTFLVSQLARQHVTVSLSGDAGDELFCGYNRYQMTANLWSKLATVPLPLRKLAARWLTSISPQSWDKLAGGLASLVPRSARLSNVGDKLHKGAEVLSSESADALYLGLVSHWHDPASIVIGGHEPATLLTGDLPALEGLDDVQRMMALDMLNYLPDDILTKVDRAAMGVSLETRVPFLDHRVVEFAWSLPQSMKLRDGQAKWALRQVLYRHVPKALIERPKMGFGVPIDSWLRGPLREWAENLLSETRLKREGFFNPAPIRQKWAEHLSGQRNWQYHLWDVLMFQAWFDEQSES